MASIRIVLDKRSKKQDGTFPIVLRITHGKETRQTTTGISIYDSEWNAKLQRVKKTYPESDKINLLLDNFRANFNHAVLNNWSEKSLNIQDIIDEVLGKSHVTIGEMIQLVICKQLEANKIGNARAYKDSMSKFNSLMCMEDKKPIEINDKVAHVYVHKMEVEGLKPNTISFHVRTLKAVLSNAIKWGVLKQSEVSPISITVGKKPTQKRALTIDELLVFSKTSMTTDCSQQAQRIFLLSYALIGISFTDLLQLQPSNIVNGRIVYVRQKTGREYSILLTAFANQLIDQLGRGNHYLLHFLDPIFNKPMEIKMSRIRSLNKQVNRSLKMIGAKLHFDGTLTTYVARHTWASVAKRNGYSYELIAEALGHSFGNPVTQIYLDRFDEVVIDDMNEKLLEVLTFDSKTPDYYV